MKIICVTGAPGSDVNKVADIFFAAGVQPAQPLRQDPSFTLASWHEKVIAVAGSDKALPAPVKQPGRFWEQYATNLFMENMQQALWGWADARSTWLLDFWQQFEPNLHVVLVYTSPQRALAEALATERAHGVDTATLMAQWEAHQKEILRFHLRNPTRTILVDAAQCSLAPGALLEACATRWGMALTPTAGTCQAPSDAAPLVGYLAEQLRLTRPDLQELQQELKASLHILLPEQADSDAGTDLLGAVEDYRHLRSAAERADLLARDLAQAGDTARDLADENSGHQRTIAELTQAVSQGQHEVAALAAANADARSEGEQILLQMHQLQEELERIYLENKKLGEIKSSKKQKIDELNNKLLQSEISVSTLKKDLDAAKSNQAAEKEKTDALAALALAKKELEAALQGIKRLESEQRSMKEAQSAAVLKKDLDAAKSNKAAEKEKTDALAALALANKELEAARQGIKRLESEQRSVKDAQQESELLLVQLHQVQEELEHYFLEHKGAAKQNEELQLRWQRMLERNPAYCDYRALDVLDNDQASQRTSWRFTDLNAAGRAFAELRFDTTVTDGVAAFAFARNGKAPSTPDALDTLTTADWLLLPILCRVLDEALQAPAGGVAQLDPAQRSTLREALAGLVAVMDSTPMTLRFDRVALKREQVNPDYEHLWLQVGNLSLGDQRWREFEFRLSCANVRPGKFGAHPKLEFPSDVGAVLFDSWFAESYDDFGDKLELRFALPEAMDMSVWEQLSPGDRDMMKALVAMLPALLTRLDDGTLTLKRALADWQQLAVNAGAILAARTTVMAPVQAPAAVPAAMPAPRPQPQAQRQPQQQPQPQPQHGATAQGLVFQKGMI